MQHCEPSTSTEIFAEIPLSNEYFLPKTSNGKQNSQPFFSSSDGSTIDQKEMMSFSVDSGISRSSVSFKNRSFDPSKTPFFPNMDNNGDKKNNSMSTQNQLNKMEQNILSQNRFAATPIKQGFT